MYQSNYFFCNIAYITNKFQNKKIKIIVQIGPLQQPQFKEEYMHPQVKVQYVKTVVEITAIKIFFFLILLILF